MIVSKRLWMAVVAAAVLAHFGAVAQVSRDTRSLIVPYPPGSSFDLVARQIQTDLGKSLGKTLIVENISGAGGSIGAQRLLAMDPNSVPLLIASPNELALPPLALKGVLYKPKDFRLVSHLTTGAVAMLVRPDFPGKDINELIERAKRPGSKPLSYGSTGNGSVFHLIGADFSKRLGVEMTHVPYRGGAPAVQDLISGIIDMTFLPMTPGYIQMAETGKLRVFAILAPDRSTALPNVPSTSEVPQLKGFYYTMWTGLFVPTKLPAGIAADIGKAANGIVGSPAFRDWVASRGNSAGAVLPLDQAAVFFQNESARFEKIAKDIKIEQE